MGFCCFASNLDHAQMPDGLGCSCLFHEQSVAHAEATVLPTIHSIDSIGGFIGRRSLAFHRDNMEGDLGAEGAG
jgi:hypothetical protein